jgi:hypothetical protein
MKSAVISLWNAQPPRTEDPNKSPTVFTAEISIPWSLVWELYQYMQAQQGHKVNREGEPYFSLRTWIKRTNSNGENNSAVLYGYIQSLSEAAAYEANKAQQGGGGFGAGQFGQAAAPAQAAPAGYVPPAQAPAGYHPAGAPPAEALRAGYAPAPVQILPPGPPNFHQSGQIPSAPAAPAPPAWGQQAPGGWGQ